MVCPSVIVKPNLNTFTFLSPLASNSGFIDVLALRVGFARRHTEFGYCQKRFFFFALQERSPETFKILKPSCLLFEGNMLFSISSCRRVPRSLI